MATMFFDDDAEGTPWEQQDCNYPEQIELIERTILQASHREGAQGDEQLGVAAKFSELRVLVEHTNFIMSWMMEYDFMPKSQGESRWLATVNWNVSDVAPHLEGDLRAELHDHGIAKNKVLAHYGVDDFRKLSRKFDERYEACLEELNNNPDDGGTMGRRATIDEIVEDYAGKDDDGIEEELESPKTPSSTKKRENKLSTKEIALKPVKSPRSTTGVASSAPISSGKSNSPRPSTNLSAHREGQSTARSPSPAAGSRKISSASATAAGDGYNKSSAAPANPKLKVPR